MKTVVVLTMNFLVFFFVYLTIQFNSIIFLYFLFFTTIHSLFDSHFCSDIDVFPIALITMTTTYQYYRLFNKREQPQRIEIFLFIFQLKNSRLLLVFRIRIEGAFPFNTFFFKNECDINKFFLYYC